MFRKVKDVLPLPGMRLSGLRGLSESTLRKAVSYGKLEAGADAREYGKQWVVTREAMRREYGEPAAR